MALAGAAPALRSLCPQVPCGPDHTPVQANRSLRVSLTGLPAKLTDPRGWASWHNGGRGGGVGLLWGHDDPSWARQRLVGCGALRVLLRPVVLGSLEVGMGGEGTGSVSDLSRRPTERRRTQLISPEAPRRPCSGLLQCW